MTDAKTKWSVQRSPDSFRPAGYDDFTFEEEMSWDSDRSPDTVSGFFAGGDGRMDAKGELAIAAGQTEAPGGRKYTYTIEAEVEDVNRQTVAGQTTVLPDTVWLPRLDTAHRVEIPAPTTEETVLTTPAVPGLQQIPIE